MSLYANGICNVLLKAVFVYRDIRCVRKSFQYFLGMQIYLLSGLITIWSVSRASKHLAANLTQLYFPFITLIQHWAGIFIHCVKERRTYIICEVDKTLYVSWHHVTQHRGVHRSSPRHIFILLAKILININ